MNILGHDSIGHYEEKVHINLFLILRVHRDRAV
jgi:hypothetical protein